MRRATGLDSSHALIPAISIHALHEESDLQAVGDNPVDFISIHALHEESDLAITFAQWIDQTFQSTLSMRRATQFKVIPS